MKVNPSVAAVDSELLAFVRDELPELLFAVEPSIPSEWLQTTLLGPVSELLRRSGKEFRAQLVEHSHALVAGPAAVIPRELPFLVELLHAGSLIVDDIEDESTTRRGGPAIHQIYGTALALNSANWLYFVPLALLLRVELSPATQIAIVRRAVDTMLRCHQGQALDLGVAVDQRAHGEVVALVHASTSLKTGSLMAFGAHVGGAAAAANPDQLTALDRFGRELGLGLQMLDDLGGVTSEHRFYKGDEDLRAARPTWPWAWVAGKLDPVSFARLQRDSIVARETGDIADIRRQLASYLGDDERGAIKDLLSSSFSGLARAFSGSPVLGEIEAQLASLTASYG